MTTAGRGREPTPLSCHPREARVDPRKNNALLKTKTQIEHTLGRSPLVLVLPTTPCFKILGWDRVSLQVDQVGMSSVLLTFFISSEAEEKQLSTVIQDRDNELS